MAGLVVLVHARSRGKTNGFVFDVEFRARAGHAGARVVETPVRDGGAGPGPFMRTGLPPGPGPLLTVTADELGIGVETTGRARIGHPLVLERLAHPAAGVGRGTARRSSPAVVALPD